MNEIKKIYNYRELLETSIKKEVRSKYKNSFLGVVWSFFNPLLQILVYAVIFSFILMNKQEHYAIFLCSGIIPWTFFSIAVNKSTFAIIENGNIIKKVYFPREIIPISFIVSGICVYFRDLQHFIGIILQLLFYATPIVYSQDSIPSGFQWILKYNPMTYIINAYRDIFYYRQAVQIKPIFYMIFLGTVATFLGFKAFNKLQRGFAEQL